MNYDKKEIPPQKNKSFSILYTQYCVSRTVQYLYTVRNTNLYTVRNTGLPLSEIYAPLLLWPMLMGE